MKSVNLCIPIANFVLLAVKVEGEENVKKKKKERNYCTSTRAEFQSTSTDCVITFEPMVAHKVFRSKLWLSFYFI